MKLHYRQLHQTELRVARRLLYEVYIQVGYHQDELSRSQEQGWDLTKLSPNPSQLVADHQNKELRCRFDEVATWYGAFDGATCVGVARAIRSEPFGLECEQFAALPISPTDVEMNRCAFKPEYRGDLRSFAEFVVATIATSKDATQIVGCCQDSVLPIYEKIGFAVVPGIRFKYSISDLHPVVMIAMPVGTSSSWSRL